MKVVLIACCKRKAEGPVAAKELYQGTLFKKSLEYAESLNSDRVYILSAEHHLLPLNKVIGKYDKTLNKMSAKQKRDWTEIVLEQMKQEGLDLQNDEFIILAGENYCKYIIPSLTNGNNKRPLKGLKIGQQLHVLNQLIRL